MQLTQVLLFLPNLGGSEIFLILAVLLLFFGAKKLPELARGFGKSIREFKDATRDVKNQIEEHTEIDKEHKK